MLPVATLLSLALVGSAVAVPKAKAPPAGFVTTAGTKFQLDGKDFYFAGSNAYYFPFNNNQTDVELGMRAAKNAGLTVFRTWGFNDKNVTYSATGLPQYGAEGAGSTDVVFQRFANGKSTIDLTAFDKVVNAATQTGIKLVVCMTNNWADYGGMDVYTVNLGGKYHDDVCPARFLYFTMSTLTFDSSTACPRSRMRTRDMLRPWSHATRTAQRSWHGSLQMSLAVKPMGSATFHAVRIAHRTY